MTNRPHTTPSPLRIGLVGAGMISRFYAAAIARSDALSLVAVCDIAEEKLGRFDRQSTKATTDLDDMLRTGDVEAVVVDIPNASHLEVCAAALRARKHVCCEKPLVLSSAQAAQLVDLAHRNDRVLFTSFHRRYNRHVRALREAISATRADGVTVRSCRVEYLERIQEHCGKDRWYLDPAVSGGGCIADNGPNAYDVARQLLGPLTVEGVAVTSRDPSGLELRAKVDLGAARGAQACLHLAWDFDGEHKAVRVELSDGRVLTADMLAGYPGFKTSLFHEYEGVLSDFGDAVAGRSKSDGDGPENVAFVEDAYRLALEVTR